MINTIRRGLMDTIGDVIEGLRAGVRTPSVNPSIEEGSGEGAFQSLVAAALDRLDCRVEVWEPDAEALAAWHPAIRPALRADGFRGRPNVVAWLPSADAPDGRRAHVILNSHADTVAPGDAAGWPHPPFAAALDGERVFGLGACDAKGSLFTFLGAAAALRASGLRLRRSAMIQSVVDEEFGGAGALECLRRGYTASAAIIGEPTGLRVCPGSRGSAPLRIRVIGRGAHPGEGWRGVNAIHHAWRYVEALDRLRITLDRTRMHPLWAAAPMGHVWNLMAVSGRSTTKTGRSVPDVCDVDYGVGLIGEERVDTMRPIVEAALAEVTAADAWTAEHPPEISWPAGGFEPAVTDPRHPAVVAVADALRGAGHPGVKVEAVFGATDGRHFVNTGGIPAINFGPGEMYLAHSPREYLPLDDLRRGIETAALFLIDYCGVA